MTKVQILPPGVAERIAAGEVVDRPVSIVKELVENSLDAGASFVEVELEEGGRQLIRVTDDGIGMEAADAELAVERHATSKLREWEDLDHLSSFGFRGEALPSIAAVSRFELITTAKGQKAGTRISIEGPLSKRVEASAGPSGTRIDVRDLFWNTPARRKFLKSASSEGVQVAELITRFAILNGKVGFRLVVNGKEKLFYRSQHSVAQRLATYWKLQEDALMLLEYSNGDIQVEGVIARPVHHRRNRSSQIIAVNGRIIRSQNLSQAFAEGYDPLVPRGRHPYCFVNLQLDPALVDVNIHPTKAEVRFADARAPFRAIYRAIRNCLDAEKVETLKESQWESTTREDSAGADGAPSDPFLASMPPVLVSGKDYKKQEMVPRSPSRPQTDRVMEMYRPPEVPVPERVSVAEQVELPNLLEKSQNDIRYLSSLYNSYLVVKVNGQLWVVDQHAAHERISYERLHRFQITGAESQGLVIPFPLELNATEKEHLQQNIERFQELGFDFSQDAQGEFELSSVPPGLPGAKVETFFSELLAELASELPTEKRTPVEQYREKLRAMMACKSSIRARERITEPEVIRLIQDLLKAEHSPYCPHGRPTRIRLDEKTLERLFHRS